MRKRSKDVSYLVPLLLEQETSKASREVSLSGSTPPRWWFLNEGRAAVASFPPGRNSMLRLLDAAFGHSYKEAQGLIDGLGIGKDLSYILGQLHARSRSLPPRSAGYDA